MTPRMKSTEMTTLLASALADGGSNGLLELLSATLHMLMDAEVDVRIQELVRLLRRAERPFRPSRIVAADGQRLVR